MNFERQDGKNSEWRSDCCSENAEGTLVHAKRRPHRRFGQRQIAPWLRCCANSAQHVIEADALGRALMEPGQAVYSAIVEHFGRQVVNPTADSTAPAWPRWPFAKAACHELSAIVHPPVIEAQHKWMDEIFAHDPEAVAVFESALIFEVVRDARARGEKRGRAGRLARLHRPHHRRYRARCRQDRSLRRPYRPSGADRTAIEADARNRLAHQVPDAEKAAQADYVLDNSGDIATLRAQVQALWPRLKQASNAQRNNP